MGKAETAALKRFGRGAAALALSVGVSYLTQQPLFIAAAPVIGALAKWLRDKFHLQNIPL